MNRGLGFGFGLISSSNIAGDPAVATLTPTVITSVTTGSGITDIPIDASSATEGHLIVLLVSIWATRSITSYPASWNLERTGTEGTSSGEARLYAFSKIAEATESSSYTFTVDGNLYGDRFTYSLLEIPRTGLGVRNASYSTSATLGKLYGYTTNTLHLALGGKANSSATGEVTHPTNYTELVDRTGGIANHAIAYKEISGSAPEYDTYAEGAVNNGSAIPSFNIDIGSGGNAAVIVSVRSESGTAAATPTAAVTVTVGGTAAPLISGATGSEQGLATNHLFGLAMGTATGNQAVVVSWTSGNAYNHAVASSFTGVDQTTPFNNGTGQGVSYGATSSTLAITSATGDLTFSDLGEKGGVHETVTVNTTQRYNLLNGDGRAVGSTAAGAASVNHIATISTGSGRAAHVGCNIRGVSLADSVSNGTDEFVDPDSGDNLSTIHLAISNDGPIISENYEGTGTPVGFTTTTDGSGSITFDETTTVLEGSKSLKIVGDSSATNETYTYVDLNEEYDHMVAIFGYNNNAQPYGGMSNRQDVHFLDDELNFGSSNSLQYGSVSGSTKGIGHSYSSISLTLTGTVNDFHYVRVEIDRSGGVVKIARSNDKTFPTSGTNYAEDTSASFHSSFSGTRAIAFGTMNQTKTTYYDAIEVTGEIKSYTAEVTEDSPIATRNLDGAAETFNGSTSYTIGDSSTISAIGTSDNFTLEAIVSVDSLSGDGTLIGLFRGGTNVQALLWFDEGGTANFRGTFRDGSSTSNRGLTAETPTGYSVAINTEYHVVYTYDGTNAKLYVDGAEVDSVAETSNVGAPSYDYEVGDDGSNSRYLDGTLRGAAIYDKALSASRILAHYNAI